jgi:hypothetical protein
MEMIIAVSLNRAQRFAVHLFYRARRFVVRSITNKKPTHREWAGFELEYFRPTPLVAIQTLKRQYRNRNEYVVQADMNRQDTTIIL